jgi:hypothetical protein
MQNTAYWKVKICVIQFVFDLICNICKKGVKIALSIPGMG